MINGIVYIFSISLFYELVLVLKWSDKIEVFVL